MKKAFCMIALAAISFGSVMAYPASAVKAVADTTKMKTKTKHHKTKTKVKTKTPKDTTKTM